MPALLTAQPVADSHGYRASETNWKVIAAVIVGHAMMLAALVMLDVVPAIQAKRPPLVIKMLALPTDPPSVDPPPQRVELSPQPVTPPRNIALPPIVRTTPPPPPLVAVAPPPLAHVAVIAPAAPKAVATSVSAPDFSTSMITAKPPKYPVESRRKREQGIVVLTVLVGISGSVTDVSVARSSGFARLDKAALDAVRRWRWTPAVRDGEPVMVKGYVDIPFVLKG